MQIIQADVLFRPDTAELRHLPEGPIDLGHGRFSWVGIQHGPESTVGSLNIFDLNTGENRHYPLDGRPGFAFPTENPAEFLIGLERRLIVFNIETGESRILTEGIDGDVAGTIINDGVDFPEGVIFGTKELTFTQPIAGLYLWHKQQQKLSKLNGGQICSNGKVIHKTDWGHALLDIDTPTKKIVVYRVDVEQGTAPEPGTVLDLNDVPAFPDGMIMAPDQNGAIISFYNPEDADYGETRHYSLETGECLTIWRTPKSPRATCPLLIEHDGKTKIVITTAVEGMSEEKQRQVSPNAGCLFAAETEF
ncbi:MAG TPA: SMP-30/gluconolactonase/LRE family protein [Planctomycetaceae bacterium]|nr:SMP-30/gluconolactonase/LRE family protein [Planctomycetaceae bacterium]